MKKHDDLGWLEEAYCKASNALTTYREAVGFNPGVRVIAQYGNDVPLQGVIAPYGDHWSASGAMYVPVILDNGRVQPWMMSMLHLAQSQEASGLKA